MYVAIAAPDAANRQLDSLYRSDSLGLVIEYDLGRRAGDRAFFASRSGEIPLSGEKSLELANIPGAMFKFTNQFHLRMLNVNFDGVAASNGYHIERTEFDHKNCRWPFSVVLKLRSLAGIEDSIVLLRKLKTSVVKSYTLSCEFYLDHVSVRQQYEQVVPSIYEDGNDAYIAISNPALVLTIRSVFAPTNSNKLFPDLTSKGLFAVPAQISSELFSKVQSRELTLQEAVTKLESCLH